MEKSFAQISSFFQKKNQQRPIPHIERTNENPKGNFQAYTILSIDDPKTNEIFNVANIDDATKEILTGLLRWGSVMQFPGGIGLDYKAPFKTNYMPEYTLKASKKIANELHKRSANYILAPDISALFWAADLSSSDDRLPILRIQKDEKEKSGDYKGALKSYTRGKDDILYIDSQSLLAALEKTNGKLRFFITDEIADTGKMIALISKLVEFMKKDGLDIQIVGTGVIIEKTFTSARKLIENGLKIPLFSALKISDMWLTDNEGNCGIAIEGITDYAFRFRKIN